MTLKPILVWVEVQVNPVTHIGVQAETYPNGPIMVDSNIDTTEISAQMWGFLNTALH